MLLYSRYYRVHRQALLLSRGACLIRSTMDDWMIYQRRHEIAVGFHARLLGSLFLLTANGIQPRSQSDVPTATHEGCIKILGCALGSGITLQPTRILHLQHVVRVRPRNVFEHINACYVAYSGRYRGCGSLCGSIAALDKCNTSD